MPLSLFRIQKTLKNVCIAAAFCLGALTFLSLFVKHADHSVMVSGVVLILVSGALLLEFLRRRENVTSLRNQLEDLEERVASLPRERAAPLQSAPVIVHAQKPRRRQSTQPLSVSAPTGPKSVVQIRDSLMQSKVSDAQVRTLLNTARNENWIDLFVQPVVSLPQRQPQFYEVFGRLRVNDTTYVSGARYLPLAEERQMQTVLDRILLMRALDTLRKLHMNGRARPYMLNIEAASLIDESFMNDLLRFVSSNKALAPYLIFELSQGAYACLNAKERAIMKALRQLGCRFSVDNITDPHFNRGLLAELGVGFLKLSSERLKAFMGTEVSVSVMQRIKQQLEKDKIAVIAERIEDEAVLREILDLELDYGQGFVFGEPEPFLDYFDKHELAA